MTVSADAHTLIAHAFNELAVGGDTDPMNRRTLYEAISQGHDSLANDPGGGGGATTLAGLTDVVLTAPANNEVLTYETASSKWKNKPIPGGVSTVFGRAGAVVAVAGDYDAFYFTEAEVTALLAGKSDTSHTHTFASLTGKPTTVGGYGITDFNSLGDARWSLLGHTHSFASLTAIPSTIGGYGITDFNSLGDARWAALTHVHAGADITTGTIDPNRLGSGLTGAKFLRGDSTWQTVAGGASTGAISRILTGNLALNANESLVLTGDYRLGTFELYIPATSEVWVH